MAILYFIALFFLGYLALSVLYLTVFAIAGRLGRADDRYPSDQSLPYKKIGVLIPAYKEDAVIIDSVNANLKQTYPADKFELIVIADSFQPHTLTTLATMPVRVIVVAFEKSTVSKALNAALAQIPDNQYDILVVSDADNHMAPDFLDRINTAFNQGWRAVQGHRVAKNTDTSVAILDAISEEINNHIFRKGSRALGLASSIIGSGMAFEPALMRKGMADLHTMGGYDKELEMNIILGGNNIAYLENALVYDEKVAKQAVFENQRTRWIAAQWQFLTHYFKRGVIEFVNGRMASAFKVIQAMVLPRVLLLGILFVCILLGLLSGQAVLWLIPLLSLAILCVSLYISVPAYLRKRISTRELMLVPVLMLRFARAIFNMRKAFKSFMPTPHTNTPDPSSDKA